MTNLGRITLFLAGVLAGIVLGAAAVSVAHARDLGQWDKSDPALATWFQNLRQPDNRSFTCCGEADAYWADSFEIQGDQYVAVITDERPNEPLKRVPRAPGTKIVVPKNKIKFDEGNPTGHGIIFLAPGLINGEIHVYCYLPPGTG